MIRAEEMRVRLGLDALDGSADELIGELIADAEAYARTYCRLRDGEVVPDQLLIRMTEEDYGRLEGAGLTSRSVSGASEYYLHAYSDGTLALLRSLRHPTGVRRAERGTPFC